MKKRKIKKELKRLTNKLSATKFLVDINDITLDQLLEGSDRFSERLNKLEQAMGTVAERTAVEFSTALSKKMGKPYYETANPSDPDFDPNKHEQLVIDELMRPATPGWDCCDDHGDLYPTGPEPDGHEYGE